MSEGIRESVVVTQATASPPRPGASSKRRSGPSNVWLRVLRQGLLRLVAVLGVLIVSTFAMVRLVPGDPARRIVGLEGSEDAYLQAREQMHLDDPLAVQFVAYLNDLVHFDLGNSFTNREPVTELIADRAVPTLQLTALAVVLALAFSVPIGIAVAHATHGRRAWLRSGFTSITGLISGLPHYLTATVLVFLFAITLTWFPPSGTDGFLYLVLPALALAARPTAMLARLVRVESTRVLNLDYIRTARSKRLPTRILHLRHVLPNVLTPAVAVAGTLVASLISGAIIVEQVFARSGLGTELVSAVLDGDYPVVQGITLFLGVGVVVINTLVELLVVTLDPQSAQSQEGT
ncbi:ABC transporter permease [Aeromicrobium choanae]|uniref:Peptide/nickel transport system permease protein n=1 Tax=Aeromicrobium choanae TaxID=1736691 RepID=A0A1T4YYJ8_9ACTN|nr:ABC transporter permease [Aeromicrobium choanae]SKB06391.1 peptide/nickel transport system permease protein [Aeromicrobium choanae]